MNNDELKNLPWRYVNIKNGEKIPIGNAWQKHPLLLNEIYTDNVGVILGPVSNGLCAIDFDGIEAIDHFNNTFPDIDITNIDTVMWSSGKEYRMQVAFYVPETYWDVLKRKVVNKLEFRWTNTQSVLPPSKLNDGREYIWLKKPTETNVLEIPESILVYWLQLMYDELTKYDAVTTKTYEPIELDEIVVDELLTRISRLTGSLQGEYDVWRTIAWATCSVVGIHVAEQLMLKHWHYKTKKELQTLRAWRSNVNGPGIGTLIKLSGIRAEELKIFELQTKIRKI
jgi:hypothetical protein